MSVLKYDEVTVGDYGFTVTVDVGEDVSGAVAVYVRFRKPGGVFVEKTGTASTQYISYKTLSGDDLTDTAGLLDVTGKAEWADRVSVSPKPGRISIVEEGGQ